MKKKVFKESNYKNMLVIFKHLEILNCYDPEGKKIGFFSRPCLEEVKIHVKNPYC